MANKKSIWSRIRLVYRPSKPSVKWVILVMVVICTLALIVLGIAINQSEEKLEEKRHYAIELEQDNEILERYMAELGTVPGMIQYAREHLGLENPNAIIFESVPSTEPQ